MSVWSCIRCFDRRLVDRHFAGELVHVLHWWIGLLVRDWQCVGQICTELASYWHWIDFGLGNRSFVGCDWIDPALSDSSFVETLRSVSIVLVPSVHSTMSVWIGYILARIGHELVDGWKIGILLTKVAVDRHLSVV